MHLRRRRQPNAIAGAALRHLTHRFFHLTNRPAGIIRPIQLDIQRVDSGKPAHGAADIQRLVQLFAPVPFRIDAQARLTAPLLQRQRQRRQQQVAGIGAVRGMGMLDQRRSGALRQAQRQLAGIFPTAGRRLRRGIARQPYLAQCRIPLPEGVFLLCRVAARVLMQVLRPTRQRRGFRRRRHRLPLRQPRINLAQVVGDDAPGNPVHQQMVRDE